MKKSEREKIRNMFDCKCAYCGKDLEKTFHVDHVKPVMRGWNENWKHRSIRAGKDEIDNMVPACPRCNRWKATFTVEEFRMEISEQVNRLRLRSAPFRLTEDYGLIQSVDKQIVFWFEMFNKE
ncbi:HNH endonuclease [Candidatus Pacearchaeota archaeon]|nr:HNH endonuclease [Candidatus Pacearchaeota archaeon]